MELSEFLLARVAEDEADIRSRGLRPPIGVGSPRRLLADCEVKRRIIGWHQVAHESSAHELFKGGLTAFADDTLKALALPYSSHPDYREEWKP